MPVELKDIRKTIEVKLPKTGGTLIMFDDYLVGDTPKEGDKVQVGKEMIIKLISFLLVFD